MLPHMKQLSLVVLITLAVHKLYGSHSRQIEVIRGEQDVFTNPKCLRGINQVRCSDCQGLDAVCVNSKNCSSCRCNGNNRTFVSTRGKYGQCVENEYLLYVTSYNSSFLVQEKDNKMCLYQYKPGRSKFRFAQVTDSCNYSISSQRWIWNRNGQLINTDTLECLEEGWQQQMENYHFVLLQRCNLNKKKQLWRCKGERSYYFSQQDSGRYMNHGNYYSYVTSYSNISIANKWRRFGTNQSLCSQAVGCERFIDGSALIILDKTKKREIVQDIGQKEIALKKSNNCSILQEQTHYLHQDVWKSLSLKDNIFKIFTSEERTFLKWNLNKTPETWKLGIIVKLNFRCKTGNTDQGRQNIHQTHCILIKFKPNITGFQPKPTGPMEKKDDGSSNTIVIVFCIIVVVALAITAIIGVLLYKRRKTRLSQPAESNITDHGQEQSSTLVMECEESLNPLYSTNTIGSQDCQLYESKPDHLYHYIDKDHKSIPKPLQNTTYDYAINDGPRNTTGQWSFCEVPDNNSAEGNNVVSQNASDCDPENKEKDRRFAVKEETLVPKEQLEESDNGTKIPEPLPKYHVLEEQ